MANGSEIESLPSRQHACSRVAWILMASGLRIVPMQTSRRLCNTAYVVLVLAFNMTVLSPIALLHAFSWASPAALEDSGCFSMLYALHYNALASFLTANLVTGAVNLLTDTLAASSELSVLILISYAAIFTAPYYYLLKFNCRLKCW
eukprot:scaffold879_cov410-Prasinococcus_capsulatus_cf.AAC.22